MIDIILGVAVVVLVIMLIIVLVRRRGSSSKTKDDMRELLAENNEALARQAIDPVRDIANRLAQDVTHLNEKSRESSTLMRELGGHTKNISDILSNSRRRGAWGEFAVERTFEAAGLQKSIHYDAQVVMSNGAKPDFILYLPDGKCLIIDSKVPLDRLATLSGGLEEENGGGAEHLKKYRGAVRKCIADLGRDNYPLQYSREAGARSAVEYVVMVVPDFALAPVLDGELITYAQENRVILTTQASLVLVAKIASMMWVQRDTSSRITRVIRSANAMHDAVGRFMESYDDVGKSLDTTKRRYEKSGSILRDEVDAFMSDLRTNSEIAAAAEAEELDADERAVKDAGAVAGDADMEDAGAVAKGRAAVRTTDDSS
ncbi:MAG: DNA recombination protein RmuC [Nitrosopumilaceae archaeon]|nr:DNA recombination protein RmuC [Nitrosopumilaceae archaeon]